MSNKELWVDILKVAKPNGISSSRESIDAAVYVTSRIYQEMLKEAGNEEG